jgi:transcriptional antiterminator NusG
MTDETQSPLSDDSELIEESSEVLEGEGSDDSEVAVEKAKPVKTPEPAESTGEVFLDSDDDDDENQAGGDVQMDWYILKVAFNREDSIADALRKKIAMEGMEEFFGDIVVPSEDIATFTRDGKKRITKRKLLPGYIMARMAINDDTWFLVRETGGISDFTGSAGKPMPMDPLDVDRFINRPVADDEEEAPIKTAIPFKVGDRVRVKEGNFENQEGDVDSVDEANGRITVIINIFGRSVPMELDHWQVEPI